MPKGQAPKLKGAICNVPLEADNVCNILPRGADSNGIVMVKLKRKLMYRGHVYFESVRPDLVKQVLYYLKRNNHLYEDIIIDEAHISAVVFRRMIHDQLEEQENPLDDCRVGANETALISVVPSEIDNENVTIAPCEGANETALISVVPSEIDNENVTIAPCEGANETALISVVPSEIDNENVTIAPCEGANETALISVVPSEIDNENVTIAPCEGANETALISVVPSEIDNENVTIAPCEGANETALISVVPSEIDNENVTIAPCEGANETALISVVPSEIDNENVTIAPCEGANETALISVVPSEIDNENVTIAPCEGANETALISVVPSEIDNENVTIAPCEGANETALISVVPSEIDNENVTIAPCEGKKPMSLLTDSNCEELAHPYLFPTGKFGYKVQRSINLTPNKYFNQRLLNYKQRFASEADYIFFAHSVYQQMNMTSCINIAMQKVKTNKLTAGMLSHNFNDTVKSFVANDEAYSFMSTIKGTPYWKKFLFEVLAMVKQLGLPTYFMTLSCADLRWNELPSIISKLNGLSLSDEEIREMDYFTRCGLLNSNPVLMARHFQYRVEMFFKEIVIDGPLGKVTYHAIRVEFQVRGSPHIHSFLWVIGAPILTKETKEEYIRFVDQVIKACLPDVNDDPELFNLVTTYQVHSHSKSCRK